MILKILLVVLLIAVCGLLAFAFWPEKKFETYQVSPEYQAQIDNFHIPPMPEGWKYDKFQADDGTNIRYGRGPINSEARATLIYMPGLTGTLDQFGEHLSYWQEQGYNVAGIDIRGQGGSDRPLKNNPEKTWVRDFSVYSSDIAALMQAHFVDEEVPVILIGQSFGAHIAYRTVSEHDTNAAALFLTAPAFRPLTGEYSYASAKRIVKIMRALGKSKAYLIGRGNWQPDVQDLTTRISCSSEPKRLYIRDAVYTNHPEQRLGGPTNQWFGELMESGEKMMETESINSVNIPVAMVLGTADDIVDNAAPTKICDSLGNCRLITLKGAGHCIPQERDEFIEIMYEALDDLVDQIAMAK